MAFTDYKSMDEVAAKHPVRIINEKFLPENPKAELPDWFIEDVDFSLSVKSSKDNEMFGEVFLINAEAGISEEDIPISGIVSTGEM